MCFREYAFIWLDVWRLFDGTRRRDECHCIDHMQFLQLLQFCRSNNKHIISKVLDSKRRRGWCIDLLFGQFDGRIRDLRRTIAICI